ncbi:9565_t:CDS:2 [Dentiscutata erythropus]|uniref:9565_t:CDS:1 n=1 Tax=Dentiscutata erythropus TaxID=1348616 RepID=A0A9N9IJW6_9GLOM|nr:9565_t:CDS:2 [Dentiscutata erythropus]
MLQEAYNERFTNSEGTISASLPNSPSSKQFHSFKSVKQFQEEINLVSLESKSQKSQGSSKQLSKYLVSAKKSNKKIQIDEFI